ncbi:RNA-directed DNA polymerase (reverse transcriptase)-related family protein [Rhynchospora pubera]|uniref:RNA-directed DNA polymerase (Reverse transcriptase)-related family protein n=1 Tax=Rhynchospora pubera TaxID=906938 RepID=A0AAV8H039_9POAL|nr:RNA-directed DNA polymerase (reverse transcriptase)-related family protein [Rhynchospora pubera]
MKSTGRGVYIQRSTKRVSVQTSTVRIFLWLLLQDRLLTQNNLLIRNWPANDGCPCCFDHPLETATHLFLLCPFANSIWNRVRHLYNITTLLFTEDVIAFWLRNRPTVGVKWDTIWAATTWTIWKERNNRIFKSVARPSFLLMQEITTLVDLWITLA